MSEQTKWILAVLFFLNFSVTARQAYHLWNWPTSVEVIVDAPQVQELTAEDGTRSYQVELPLDQFPFDVQLRQHLKYEAFSLAIVNLLLLSWLAYSLRLQQG